MNRRHIFLIALVAALGVMAFGATDAFASYFKFNHSTGQMTYTESGFPGTSPANDVRVHVDPIVNGFYVIDDVNDVVEQEQTADLAKYCYVYDFSRPIAASIDSVIFRACAFSVGGKYRLTYTCPRASPSSPSTRPVQRFHRPAALPALLKLANRN